MKAGIEDPIRAVLASRFKRLYDEANGDDLSEAYRVMSFGISILTLTGTEETLKTIRGTGSIEQAVVALFGDLWKDEQ